MVLSKPPLASSLPSGLKATVWAPSVCPVCNTNSGRCAFERKELARKTRLSRIKNFRISLITCAVACNGAAGNPEMHSLLHLLPIANQDERCPVVGMCVRFVFVYLIIRSGTPLVASIYGLAATGRIGTLVITRRFVALQ